MPMKLEGTRPGQALGRLLAAGAILAAMPVAAGGCTTPEAIEPTVVGEGVGEIRPDQAPDVDAGGVVTERPSEPVDVGATPEGQREWLAAMAESLGVAAVTPIEDWTRFGSADGVEDTISRNLGMGDNTMDLSLEPATGQLPAGNALLMAYDIQASEPHDFVGFNRSLDTVEDWSGATGFGLWVVAEGDGEVRLVFQFREDSGEVWRYEGPMPDATTPAALLPIDTDAFQWADWSTTDNGEIDLAAIDQYGLYVGHAGPQSTGSARFGPIVRVP